jgi:Flp pilus assembly protein TadG
MANHRGLAKYFRRRLTSRRGATLVISVTALVALLGCTALSLDVGMVMVAASQVQAVADSAALAAVGGGYGGQEAAAHQRISQIIEANQSELTDLTWNPAELVVYGAGDTVPSYGELATGEEAVRVTVRSAVNYHFARVLGLSGTVVERRATALGAAGSPGPLIPALFAGDSSSSSKGISLNGSGTYVGGDVVSNSKVSLEGDFHTITGNITYRTELLAAWWNRPYLTNGQASQTNETKPYPLDHVWEDFLPWHTRVVTFNPTWNQTDITIGRMYVTGDFFLTGTSKHLHDGIVLVDGNVSISGDPHQLTNVTIIARGTITMVNHHCVWTPYTKNLACMSLSNKDNWAISVSGNHHQIDGDMFAPNGGIYMTGDSQYTFNGSLVGKHITNNGSRHRLATTRLHTGGGGGGLVKLIR